MSSSHFFTRQFVIFFSNDNINAKVDNNLRESICKDQSIGQVWIFSQITPRGYKKEDNKANRNYCKENHVNRFAHNIKFWFMYLLTTELTVK